MADTFIYAIKVTGESSIHYDEENKSARIVRKDNSEDTLQYIMRDKKGNFHNLSGAYLGKIKDYVSIEDNGRCTFRTLSTFLNCSEKNTYNDWVRVRNEMNPTRGNQGNIQYCIVQNFGSEYVDPVIANEIGVRFAQEYLPDYQCVVSTHVNTGLIHNHIEFNATAFTDGKKFNDRLNTVYDIRSVSDKLCREYGLSVMEATTKENARVAVYKDGTGKTHYFEPTDRKKKSRKTILEDVTDYRNYWQYTEGCLWEKSHVDTLKEDMESVIHYATSYDNFLKLMEHKGYEIKAKTKDGRWRKHISFRSPEWEKSIRDSQIGDGYLRKSIEGRIEKINRKGNVQGKQYTSDPDIYAYGKMVIEDLDHNFRYQARVGGCEKVKRSDIERLIVLDTKQMNKEIDTAGASIRQDREEYLIGRINSNLRTLRFVEEKGIQSISQLNDMVKSLYVQRNACHVQIKKITAALKILSDVAVMMDDYRRLQEKIEANATNPDYVLYDQEDDVAVLKSMETCLRGKKLIGDEKQKKFRENLERFRTEFEQLKTALRAVNSDIKQFDDCVSNISTLDKKGKKYEAQIESYYNDKKHYNTGERI